MFATGIIILIIDGQTDAIAAFGVVQVSRLASLAIRVLLYTTPLTKSKKKKIKIKLFKEN